MLRLLGKPFFLLFYLGYLVLIGPLSLWMLLNAPTWVGKAVAVVGLLLLPVPFLMARWEKDRRRQSLWVVSLGTIFVIVVNLALMIVVAAPSGQPDSSSPIQHRFFRDGKYGRFALTNIIPESEQVNLGFLLMTYVDPILTQEQANAASAITMDLYQEMEQDPHFHEVGSAMGLAYRDVLGRPYDVGHYYLYVPEHESDKALPAIIFLHGSAGNFKSYSWVWSQLAEQEKFVVIAPSYGFGNWDQEGIATVLDALADAKSIVNIDESQLYLAGLSNGGLGVSYIANHSPELFQGLIFISPVMANQIVDAPSFQNEWNGRPILVITGETDRRIPLNYVENRVAQMDKGNIDVTFIVFPKEDHFLFYSQANAVMANIVRWLQKVE